MSIRDVGMRVGDCWNEGTLEIVGMRVHRRLLE